MAGVILDALRYEAQGEKMAVLGGYAVKMGGIAADHTYVMSDDGRIWPCWGRSSGGREICSGEGDSNIAQCLSESDSHAGIIYGITGLCHQTANRILFPAEAFVDRASCYEYSVLAFGVYGLGLWPELEHCVNLAGSSQTPPGETSPGGSGEGDGGKADMAADKQRELYNRIKAVYQASAQGKVDIGDVHAIELKTMLESSLGKDYDKKKQEAIVQLQRELHESQRQLAFKLQVGSITPRQYVHDFHNIFEGVLQRCEDVLGSVDFIRVFGGKRKDALPLIDEATFLSQRK